MVYVFGMEGVPIFELLFVIMVLMLGGLVFILLELRKLVALIAEEKLDITRFEQDLSQFENKGGTKKPSDELVAYIKDAQKKGLSSTQIEGSLQNAGWQQRQIEELFQKIK
jgi:hypothetical protein